MLPDRLEDGFWDQLEFSARTGDMTRLTALATSRKGLELLSTQLGETFLHGMLMRQYLSRRYLEVLGLVDRLDDHSSLSKIH